MTFARLTSACRMTRASHAPSRPCIAVLLLMVASADAKAQDAPAPADTMTVTEHARQLAAEVPVGAYFVGGVVTAPLLVGTMLTAGRGRSPSPVYIAGAGGFLAVAGWTGRSDVQFTPEIEIAMSRMESVNAELFARTYRETTRSRRSKAFATGSVVGILVGVLLVANALDD